MTGLPLPGPFHVSVERRGADTILAPTGELDLDSAPTLDAAVAKALAAEAGARLLLDLRGLEFVDSSGMRALVMAHQSAEKAGMPFSLVTGHRGIERSLQIAGLMHMFAWTSPEFLA